MQYLYRFLLHTWHDDSYLLEGHVDIKYQVSSKSTSIGLFQLSVHMDTLFDQYSMKC